VSDVSIYLQRHTVLSITVLVMYKTKNLGTIGGYFKASLKVIVYRSTLLERRTSLKVYSYKSSAGIQCCHRSKCMLLPMIIYPRKSSRYPLLGALTVIRTLSRNFVMNPFVQSQEIMTTNSYLLG